MRNLILLAMALGVFASCEQIKTDTTPPSDFLPLQIGNYWIYQHVDLDEHGIETTRTDTDSVIVSRDTLIRGQRYFILAGTNHPIVKTHSETLEILRDSAGCIVNEKGLVLFSENIFSEVLASRMEVHNGDTLYTLTYSMEPELTPCTVPAGQYVTLDYRGTVIYGVDVPHLPEERYLHTHYARGVGKVLSSYFYLNNPGTSEKRLLRYNIGPW